MSVNNYNAKKRGWLEKTDYSVELPFATGLDLPASNIMPEGTPLKIVDNEITGFHVVGTCYETVTGTTVKFYKDNTLYVGAVLETGGAVISIDRNDDDYDSVVVTNSATFTASVAYSDGVYGFNAISLNDTDVDKYKSLGLIYSAMIIPEYHSATWGKYLDKKMFEGSDFIVNELTTSTPTNLLTDISAGTGISIDKTDPKDPIISVTSLALVDHVVATETSIADFAAASAGYTFQQGDVIDITDGSGTVLLYLYDGGTKTDVASYRLINASEIDWSAILNVPQFQAVVTGTHAEILALQTAGDLVVGNKYVITDYVTKYTQPVTDLVKTAAVGETLVLTATSANTFDVFVQSVEFPKDVIKYDIANVTCEAPNAAQSRKGKITYRLDSDFNETNYDHRTVVFDVLGVDTLTFGANSVNNSIKNVNDFYGNTFGNGTFSNTFGNGTFGNTFGSDTYGNYFGSDTYGNTFGSDTYGNFFVNGTFNNTFGSGTHENNIGNNISNLTVGNNFRKNTVENDINFTGIDFSAATHVYANYACTIFKDAGGNIRLRYRDATGAEQVVAVNA